MGISSLTLGTLNSVLNSQGIKYKNLEMCELGNQWMFLNPAAGVPYKSSAKPYFESLGAIHTSMDQNGQDGAIEIDLGQEIAKKYRNKFDLVTNFGTSEHVYSFYNALRNIHLMCKLGGIIFNVTPKTGHWPKHGNWYITETFCRQLAELAQYEILALETQAAQHNVKSGQQIVCAFKKTNYKFASETDFDKLEIFKE